LIAAKGGNVGISAERGASICIQRGLACGGPARIAMDSERTLTVETGPPRKPRYRRPAADVRAPDMRRAAEAGSAADVGCAAEAGAAPADVGRAAEMHSATAAHPRTAAEVSTPAKMTSAAHGMRGSATPAEMASAAPAMTSASAASSWSRIGGACQNGRQNNNGEDFDV
jgi:hypothetical protein